MKKVIILLFIILAMVTLGVIIKLNTEFKLLKEINETGIGKSIDIIIEPGQKADYNYLRMNPYLLKDSEIKKLVQYMKSNNLFIIPGRYVINQSDSFEKMIQKFRFEKIRVN